METQQNLGANESKLQIGFFFLSLGVLISLITSVVSFINLVFEALNKRFPDVLNSSYEYGYSTWQYEGMRAALATLIIFFPVYLLVSYFWKKFEQSGLLRYDVLVKKWLIYIILFLSSVVVIVDLNTLVRYFISGEITTRFVLKVVTVLVAALVVGLYYMLTLREDKMPSLKRGWVFGSISVLIVLVAVVWSFTVMGSPAEQRKLRLDDRRVNDLSGMQYQIINYWQQKEKLPETLEELKNPISGVTLPVPPEFEKGEKYEYNVLDAKALKFELCATFSLPMPKGWREYSNGGIYPMPMYDKAVSVSYPYPGSGGVNDSWDHEAGRTCFERTIDKDIYPPYRDPKPY